MPPQVFLFQLKKAAPSHFWPHEPPHLPSPENAKPLEELDKILSDSLKKRRVKRKNSAVIYLPNVKFCIIRIKNIP